MNSTTSKKERFIVMPFQPKPTQDYNGIGLGLHFLLGNVMAARTLLLEFWFGWRVNKLFKHAEEIRAFCKGESLLDNLELHAKKQKIKYWLNGTYHQNQNHIVLNLNLSVFNETSKQFSKEFSIDLSDNFIGFRNNYILWLASCSLPFETGQVKKIMWPESISIKALDHLGRAMEATYINYTTNPDDPIELDSFEKAVFASPDSYLTWDMNGWGLYKNKLYQEAEYAFKKAIAINKDGLGALSGLMWCYIKMNNKALANQYAIAKADVRNENHEKAITFVENKIKNLFDRSFRDKRS